MLNIITALKTEADPIIKYFKLKPNGKIYHNNYINLIFTGSGKIKSAVNTALLLSNHLHPTLNIGICGSNRHDVGEGFFISKIIDTDSGYEYYPDFYKKPSTLHTVSKTGKYYLLTDMEGSGFFEAAYRFLNVEEIILYKIVSDTPKKMVKKEEIPNLVQKHINVIEELLEMFDKQKNSEIDNILKEINSKMKLTKTQHAQIRQLVTYLYLSGRPIPPVPKMTKKEEVKEFITSLSSLVLF